MNEDSHAVFRNIVPRGNPPILINTQLSVGCGTAPGSGQSFPTVFGHDLSRHEEQVESPAWHEGVLQEREERVIWVVSLPWIGRQPKDSFETGNHENCHSAFNVGPCVAPASDAPIAINPF